MSHDDLQQEVAQLRQKLQKTQLDFQNYKKSSKELEEFIEEQSSKKEAEIRKLKEELILKEKGLKQAKQELAMLQNDNTALKAQASKQAVDSSETAKYIEHIKRAQDEIISLKEKNNQLAAKATDYQAKIADLVDERNTEKKQFDAKTQYLNEELAACIKRIETLQQQKVKLAKQSSPNKSKTQITPKRESEIDNSHHKKQLEVLRSHFDREREGYQQKIRKLQQGYFRAQKQLKDSKHKVQALLEQNERLQSRTVNVTINSLNNSPSPMLIKSSLEDEDLSLRPSYHCMLLTKPHYISPFLEIYQQRNLIKIYKSSRSGCFEKSMGCYKHKFDKIAFQQQALLEPIISRIKEYQEQTQHSIFLFGAKKTIKKYLMSKLVVNLKDFLVEKMEAAEHVEAIFLKRSQEEQKNFALKGNNRETALQVIDKVIALGYKNQKVKDKLASPRKTHSKPKVRYFKLKAGDFALQIGTSSFTSLSFREKTSVASMLNNILYSKLPNILQSSLAQKYIVLTLNPIVDLYQECKNTLSSTFCRSSEQNREDMDEVTRSPIRDENLNDVAKRKLESFQRLSQETSIKIRKLEDQCGFYKTRFDELEFRLKNLLNTHSAQNTYLKKSPITLSYEKLLKFVHSVQSRNGVGIGGNQSLLKASNIYSEKDPESMEAL